jgi:hypothetical protein
MWCAIRLNEIPKVYARVSKTNRYYKNNAATWILIESLELYIKCLRNIERNMKMLEIKLLEKELESKID